MDFFETPTLQEKKLFQRVKKETFETPKPRKPDLILAPPTKPPTKAVIDDRPKITTVPSGRQSEPDYEGSAVIDLLKSQYALITPDFLTEIVPLIRMLVKMNPDVGQALDNIVTLGNTGHKINFDRKVSPDKVDAMRNHLVNKRKNWAPGQAGIDGLVNKMISQVMIGGALSYEAVPNNILTGIEQILLINPETIVFQLQSDKLTYLPYQRVRNAFLLKNPDPNSLVKLNINTYQYYALNGDGENPHGFPPYMPAVNRVYSQGKMNQNIDFIVDVMGLVGFLEVLITPPDQIGDESDSAYEGKLDGLLAKARQRVLGGLKDGVVVGIKDDHEFKFNSASKNFEQVAELYKTNELQVASGLKQDASLWGRDYGTSEAKANITFIKMLSQLKNIQNIVKTALEFIYQLELRLAGFQFDYLSVQFNRSTLQDDYRYQQAEEIKVKNVIDKMVSGLINQEQAADELGYEAPAYPKPMVSWEVLAGGSDPKPATPGAPTAKKKRQGQKNKSAKKTRDNRKTVQKTK
jgi:hypothetical protein